ncbi:hypothetical protein FS827_23585 [Agrobacterium vitis]|uniref:hypothetical protein n=1 Tax=Allorhizobium ampelinum TaxID=3025782 RepID=UPI001F485DF4|nr:hypothetical protein [Allorhizobium ampelinum]MCF1464283.1 hypothetical protein [Allorhizobium ampelinum]
MILLKSDSSWKSCEEALGEIAGSRSREHLAVPNRVKSAYLGGEVSQAQVITTWATGNPDGELRTWADDLAKAGSLVEGLPGLVAGLLRRRMRTAVGERELDETVYRLALRRLDALHDAPPERDRGMRVNVVCADHLGRKSPRAFYREVGGGQAPVTLAEFEPIVDRILELTVPPAYSGWLSTEHRGVVTDLLYEAFKNTHEHARSDLKGRELPISFRGITVRHHSFQRKNLAQAATESVPLSGFLERLEPPMAGNKHIQLLEMSVFDCGIGYASHLRCLPLEELAPDDELAAVNECFEKNVSSKSLSGSGQGLALIDGLLSDNNGFLRLRTGRLSVCRSGSGPLELVDTVTGGKPAPRTPVCGTVLTCVLPMRKL